jgi:predicted MFS family arabinose efflux permease
VVTAPGGLGQSRLTTAAPVGTALGAALVGRLIDSHGAAAAYLFAFAAGFVPVPVVTLGRRQLGR